MLKTLAIAVGRYDIRADLYNADADLLIEAKASAMRKHLRLAVGQLLDYVRYAPAVVGSTPKLAVLVPDRPDQDLLDYLSSVGVAAIWRRGKGFIDSSGGKFTQPLTKGVGGTG